MDTDVELPDADSVASQATAVGTRSERSTPPDLIGTLVAERYRILDLVGVGGMGIVYLAEHIKIRKKFALKVLGANFVSNLEFVDRFLQEARSASAVSHPNVIEITDFGETESGVPFFAMEYLEGEELNAIIKREGAQPWVRVRELLLQLLAALEAAHEQGVVHRDVKPHNCFLVDTPEGRDFLKVLDFGIAKVVSEDADFRTLTPMGAMLGTAQYMAPEQARSERVDKRVDVYAAGVIAFELLTGKVPYRARGMMGVVSKLLTEDLPTIEDTNPDVVVSPAVEGVLRKAMAKDREDRYASAAEFAAALRKVDGSAGLELLVEERSTRSFPALHTATASHARVLWVRPAWMSPTLVIGVLALLVASLLLLFAAQRREQSIASLEQADSARGSLRNEAPNDAANIVVSQSPSPLLIPDRTDAPPNTHAPPDSPIDPASLDEGAEQDTTDASAPEQAHSGETPKHGGSTKVGKSKAHKPAGNTKYEVMIDVRKRCQLEIDGTASGCKHGQVLHLSAGAHQLRWRFPDSSRDTWVSRRLTVKAGPRSCLLLFSDDFQLSAQACSGG